MHPNWLNMTSTRNHKCQNLVDELEESIAKDLMEKTRNLAR